MPLAPYSSRQHEACWDWRRSSHRADLPTRITSSCIWPACLGADRFCWASNCDWIGPLARPPRCLSSAFRPLLIKPRLVPCSHLPAARPWFNGHPGAATGIWGSSRRRRGRVEEHRNQAHACAAQLAIVKTFLPASWLTFVVESVYRSPSCRPNCPFPCLSWEALEHSHRRAGFVHI